MTISFVLNLNTETSNVYDDYLYMLYNNLGDEGQGSIHADLIESSLILSLAAGRTSHINQTELYLTIGLTDKGLDQWETIIVRIFQFINHLKTISNNDITEYYSKLKRSSSNLWQCKPEEPGYRNVETISLRMQNHKSTKWVSGDLIAEECDPNLFISIVNQLTPNNFFIMMQSKKFENLTDKTENISKAKYSIQDIEPSFIEKLFHLKKNEKLFTRKRSSLVDQPMILTWSSLVLK